ncbi:MAG: HAD family hydrolase [Nitrospirota bacterium]
MKGAVFFDLYGTLIDIKTDEYDPWVYTVLSKYLSYNSINVDADELKRAYFECIRQYIDRSAETYPEVDVYNVFSDIMNRYGSKRYSRQAVLDTILLFRSLTIRQFSVLDGLYDGIVSICKRFKTAIISDAQWSFSEPEIQKLGLDHYFKIRIFSSRVGFKKPDTRMFTIAMEKLKARAEESVYIGDNPPKDLIGAKNAGLKFILFRNECKSYNGFMPDACFNEYRDLSKILKEII